MNLLYITPYVPSPIRTRPYNLIRTLVRLGHQITLLTAADGSPEEEMQADELRRLGADVELFPVPVTRSLANCLLALPTGEPLQAVYAYHPAMERRLRTLLQQQAFDVVHIEHLRAARLVRAATALRFEGDGEGTPVIYDSVDCISLLFEQAAQSGAQLRSRLMTTVDLGRTRAYEAWLLTQYDQVVITSRRDKEALEDLAHSHLPPETEPAPITVVTNGVDLDYFQPREQYGPREPQTIAFTGKMSYHANVTAVLYFTREVLPRIWAKDPHVRFQIVGKDPPEAVRQLAADGRIEVTGTVDDLRPYLARATVAVCPTLYAVGIQNKVLEAMAMATPVVTTPAGCAALEAKVGQEILIADGADALAAAILLVVSDPSLAGRLSNGGRRFVETHHSWEASARRLMELYEQARTHTSRHSSARSGMSLV